MPEQRALAANRIHRQNSVRRKQCKLRCAGGALGRLTALAICRIRSSAEVRVKPEGWRFSSRDDAVSQDLARHRRHGARDGGSDSRRRVRTHRLRCRRELACCARKKRSRYGGRQGGGAGRPGIEWHCEFHRPSPSTWRRRRADGLDGVMVMPAQIYSSKPHETRAFPLGRVGHGPSGHGQQPPIPRTTIRRDLLAGRRRYDRVGKNHRACGFGPSHRR